MPTTDRPPPTGGSPRSRRVLERRDGATRGVVGAPDGWLFLAPGFRRESPDRLLARVVRRDGQHEGLVRCRPDTRTCERGDAAG